MPDVQADFLQLFRHPWPAIAAQSETKLFFDMCLGDEIGSLSAAGRTASESTQIACAETNDTAQAISWKAGSVFFENLNLIALGPRRTGWPVLGFPSPPRGAGSHVEVDHSLWRGSDLV